MNSVTDPDRAAVIVPMYKAELTAAETASLRQLNGVLHAWPRIIAKPEGLDLTPLARACDMSQQSFPPDYFRSNLDYNRLMLSPEFYDRFATHEFLLIHQLDAWCFEDRLEYWCGQNFDLLGAPFTEAWMYAPPLNAKRLRKTAKQTLARYLGARAPRGWRSLISANAVGNGGFSLRRVKTFSQVLQADRGELDKFRHQPRIHGAEDLFWSLHARLNGLPLSRPDWRTALHFAIERAPLEASRLLGGVPFGCHGWSWLWTEHEQRAVMGFSTQELTPTGE
ncbi:MAG: hypothetical protein CMN28_02175 [Salinisphaeraceae bacterium]|nr:hypothetical protein [Salinisphaeraceae bacterium]